MDVCELNIWSTTDEIGDTRERPGCSKNRSGRETTNHNEVSHPLLYTAAEIVKLSIGCTPTALARPENVRIRKRERSTL